MERKVSLMKELCDVRGYYPTDEDIVSNILMKTPLSNKSFWKENAAARYSFVAEDENERRLYFVFNGSGSVIVSVIEHLLDHINKNEEDAEIIFSIGEKLSMSKLKFPGRSTVITIFSEAEMIVNPLTCMLGSSYTVIDPSTLKDINPKSLPDLLEEDIISKWYGFRAGMIVEIERSVCIPGSMVGTSIHLRRVK